MNKIPWKEKECMKVGDKKEEATDQIFTQIYMSARTIPEAFFHQSDKFNGSNFSKPKKKV